jgi:two-component system, chemotaxis family, protein-glutamate methylesterase/glutaminase
MRPSRAKSSCLTRGSAMPARAICVLIVDDSALIRQLLTKMLASDPAIEVVDSACDPYVARQKIAQLNPDVITLDVEMPRLDSIEFLKKVMTLRPMPVVMVSSVTQAGCEATLQALQIGAVDFVAKPTYDLQAGVLEKQAELVAKVKAAALANVSRRALSHDRARTVGGRGSAYSPTEKIVAIGASTGGSRRSPGSGRGCRRSAPPSSSPSTCRKISPRAWPIDLTGCAPFA